MIAFAAALLLQAQQLPIVGAPSHFHEPDPIEFDEHAGFTRMFDGTSLKGWMAIRPSGMSQPAPSRPWKRCSCRSR